MAAPGSGLQRFADVAGDGAPRLDAAAGEELVRVDRAASVALGGRSPEPPGTLFVTTRRVIWLSEAEKGKGYAVDFLAITLHAVSRDLEAYPSPCLYTQIEAEIGTDDEAGESNPEANDELELSKVSEMHIILGDPGQFLEIVLGIANTCILDRASVDALFDVFCHCAELNPDPNAERNGENGWFHGEDRTGGGWVHGDEDMVDENGPQFFNANPIGQNGEYDLSHSVFEVRKEFVYLQINDQRFEDAEEEQESHENGH
ncbi:Chloride conductance regulatory protein ICln [Dichanthelium oligosanthes]|uniref:Chloride conductance regulatory protein ICln n=1 Tax=Dichanthelium oligosanthes TaxID=888268 RepID=A0A1E5V8E7_9POAL|nr:Chloride conductance regulatory protein ICln [Dichanthelium oligosanthes]